MVSAAGVAGWARTVTVGNLSLFRFWLAHLLSPFTHLPSELFDETAMAARLSKHRPFELQAPRSQVDEYEAGLGRLSDEIGRLSTRPQIPAHTKQWIFWAIRLATVAAAFAGSPGLCFGTSLVQFVFLPLSLFVALSYGAETIMVLYTGHMVVFPLLSWLLARCLPGYLNPTITISPAFLAVFLLADQLLCCKCLYTTPKGATVQVSPARVRESVWYGFLNCKTYYLVLLPLAFGLEVPVLVWLLDAGLGLSNMISSRAYWQVLFYHAHRMGHIPRVYQDAHKFHHHLHDTTAFDAHIFGSGAPEEWLILVADVGLALNGIMPASLSYHVLGVSWYNKWGFHSRSKQPDFHPDNFHADHHSLHQVNFGFSYPYELLMRTVQRKLLDGTGTAFVWNGYRICRLQDEQTVTLQFEPAQSDKPVKLEPSLRDSLKAKAWFTHSDA